MIKQPLRLYCDARLGNCPKYTLSSSEPKNMFIPDDIKKCAVFLGIHKGADLSGTPDLIGTAFIVGMPLSRHSGKNSHYLVTAKHVIEYAKKHSFDAKIYVRFNTLNSHEFVGINLHEWAFHPSNTSVDVAAVVFPFGSICDQILIPRNNFCTMSVIESEQIGIGDEVFLVGLFKKHYGDQKNIPIVRVGNIAAIPEESVFSKEFGSVDSPYLIECRSIGGLSGSPIFVFSDRFRSKIGAPAIMLADTDRTHPAFFLLGLMHGHWDCACGDIGISPDSSNGESVNMGIAIVVPADQIAEVLEQDSFQRQRDQRDDEISMANAATPDSMSE